MKAVKLGATAMLIVLAACSKQGGSVTDATDALRNGTSADALEESGEMTPAEKAARAAAGDGDTANYNVKLPLKEFMPHVMQYAGDGIWKRQGYVIDAKGERSLFPTNDEEWEEAESAALALAEMTNVLLIPGRRVPDPEWDKAVEAVRQVAVKAAAAAEKKNADLWFEAGGELDEACDVCHERFDPTFKAKPTPKIGNAPPAG